MPASRLRLREDVHPSTGALVLPLRNQGVGPRSQKGIIGSQPLHDGCNRSGVNLAITASATRDKPSRKRYLVSDTCGLTLTRPSAIAVISAMRKAANVSFVGRRPVMRAFRLGAIVSRIAWPWSLSCCQCEGLVTSLDKMDFHRSFCFAGCRPAMTSARATAHCIARLVTSDFGRLPAGIQILRAHSAATVDCVRSLA